MGLIALLGLGVVPVVTSCGDDENTVAGAARGGGQDSVDGQVQQISSDRRAEPVSLSGSTLDGKDWSLANDATNKVVVVNVWGSWCGPCVEEMPMLQQVWTGYQQKPGSPVQFLGIDQDSRETGAAAAQRFGLTFPSLVDESRTMPLALQGKAQATPTTLVLDRQHRIAARIAGPIPTELTLRQVIDTVVAEGG